MVGVFMAELNIGCNEARAEFNKLMNAFQNYNQDTSKSVQIKSKVVSNSYNNEQYPEDYGGAYFDFSLGKLVVCLTEKNGNYYKDLLNSSYVIYKNAQHSLNELLEFQNKIYNVMSKYNISSSEIRQKENIIYISFTTDDCKNDFSLFCQQNNIPSSSYKIINNNPVGIPLRIAYSGDRVYVTDVGYYEQNATIGFNAYLYENGKKKYGVVTAGHSFIPSKTYYTDDGTIIGMSKEQYVKYTETIDAMFIPFTNQAAFTPTKKYIEFSTGKVRGDIMGLKYIAPTMEGDVVVKYGFKRGRSSGQIVSAFYSGTYPNGATYKDFFSTDCIGKPGDSGGPIGIETSNNGSCSMLLVGISSQGKIINPEIESESPDVWVIGCKLTNMTGTFVFVY